MNDICDEIDHNKTEKRAMVNLHHGDIFRIDLSRPIGSSPGNRRQLLRAQPDSLNRSKIAAIVFVPLTRNMEWAKAPEIVELPKQISDFTRDSVANVSQIITIDIVALPHRVGKLPSDKLQLILSRKEIIVEKQEEVCVHSTFS